MTPRPEEIARQLCLSCGLCCNGVLFRDVELQDGDDAERLAAAGIPLERRKGEAGKRTIRFPQPCAALCADNRCRIYDRRPARCRDFECALFQAVRAGAVNVPLALRTINRTRKQAQRVDHLLRLLGDDTDQLALSLRFQRTRNRLEAGGLEAAAADTFAELTLAVHNLNRLLRESFYPDPAD